MVPIVSGKTYNAELIDKSIDALTNAAGIKGYAFAEIHPRISRNRAKHTIDVIFDIEQPIRILERLRGNLAAVLHDDKT